MNYQLAELKSGDITVVTPYNARFVKRCRELNGTWRSVVGLGKAWTFPASLRDDVIAAVRDIYGYDFDKPADNAERITLRVTVHDDMTARCDSVRFGNYVLARAFGRDSGARPGEDVAKISGHIRSGGSRANWTSGVDAGTVFKIVNVPLSVAEHLRDLACEGTFSVTVDADDVDRPLPEGVSYDTMWQHDDGRKANGYSWRKLDDSHYRWTKREKRPLFTVEEI